MKPLGTIPFLRLLGTALILALILLSSPCSVRNYLERFLEVEQTEVSYKSKTTTCKAKGRLLQHYTVNS